MISESYRVTLRLKNERKPWGGTMGKYAGEVLTRSREGDRILDFGCAKQDLKKRIKELAGDVIEVVGYDPAQPGLDVFPSGTFDTVVATDVLEHVEPDMLESTMRNLEAVCKRQMYFVVGTVLTGNQLPDGRDHHLIVQPRRWWEEFFAQSMPEWKYEFCWDNRKDFACWLTRA